jgi:hypothetical protein
MKLLNVGGGSYLTGSDIADAVLRYGLVLAKRRDIDLVDIPFVVGGRVKRAAFMIGWRCETRAVTWAVEREELVEVGTTFALDGKASAARERQARAFTPEEAAALTWPDAEGGPAL